MNSFDVVSTKRKLQVGNTTSMSYENVGLGVGGTVSILHTESGHAYVG